MKTHLKAATFAPKTPQTQITTTLQRHSINQNSQQKLQPKTSYFFPSAATKFPLKSPQTQIKTTLQRHSISQSLIGKTEDKASSNIDTKNTTSLSHNKNKISFVDRNLNISAKNQKNNTNICSIPTQVSFNNIQISKLQTIRKKAINSNFRRSKTRQENSNSTSVNPVLLIQRQSIIKKENKNISQQRKFDRLYNKFTSNPNNETFFTRLYNFQRKRSNWKFVETRSEIKSLRQKLVDAAVILYPNKINLNGANSITYVHTKNPKKPKSFATAYRLSREIKVWRPCMGKEINTFLNTIRHEGFHIAQFNAIDERKIPKNKNLLEFLSEYSEIVGGFKESIKPFSGDVARLAKNYEKIDYVSFIPKVKTKPAKRWFRKNLKMILERGIKVEKEIQKRRKNYAKKISILEKIANKNPGVSEKIYKKINNIAKYVRKIDKSLLIIKQQNKRLNVHLRKR